ncbi:MAG TPA: M48 family metalloprotease, partial [Candidatus Solibacter sp.]|nr:M48 family metalloprotease [Candidatus Solibacter sp.]
MIDDPEATSYLAALANRMAEQLPGEHPKLRVFLVDLPANNAFSLAGGRIYVTRKMVAFLRGDDEMAGLLGHEMGHILSGQFGVEMTAWFRGVLGVT